MCKQKCELNELTLDGSLGATGGESVFIGINILRMNTMYKLNRVHWKQKRSTEGCSKFKGPETRQVQERLVSTLEHMQVPKWNRTRSPEE